MKVVMHPAVSLDGYIAKLDGDSASWVNQDDEARYQAEVKRCGCVLVGHTTYEDYADDFAAYRDVIIFVCTNETSLEDTEAIKFIRGTAEELIREVKSYNFTEVVVCGGGELNGLLAEAGVVDEIVVSYQSAILGSGIPLFGTHRPDLQLELLETNTDIAGVVQNHYKVLR